MCVCALGVCLNLVSSMTACTDAYDPPQVSAPGSTFLGTLASEAWEEQRVRLNEGGHFVNLKKFRKWGGPNKLAEVESCCWQMLHVHSCFQ